MCKTFLQIFIAYMKLLPILMPRAILVLQNSQFGNIYANVLQRREWLELTRRL